MYTQSVAKSLDDLKLENIETSQQITQFETIRKQDFLVRRSVFTLIIKTFFIPVLHHLQQNHVDLSRQNSPVRTQHSTE